MYIVLFLLLFTCCNNTKSNSDSLPEQKDNIVLTKEEKLIKLYNTTVIPLFSVYDGIEIPIEFQIIEEDLDINAGAAFGYVEVSKGLINIKKESIQLFALSHEVAHIATLNQAKLFNLEGYVSCSSYINEYIKAEYLADLIAIHLIKSKEPLFFEDLKNNFKILRGVLGNQTFTHPSGEDRINAMNDYIELSNTKTGSIAFKDMYLKIWKDSIQFSQ